MKIPTALENNRNTEIIRKGGWQPLMRREASFFSKHHYSISTTFMKTSIKFLLFREHGSPYFDINIRV